MAIVGLLIGTTCDTVPVEESLGGEVVEEGVVELAAEAGHVLNNQLALYSDLHSRWSI